MELKITQNIKPEDLLRGISWHGETNHDNEAVEKLKELNEFVSDLVAKIFFFQLQMEQVATNQNNLSAKELSEEAKKLLVNVAKMTMEEESWEAFEKVEQERKSSVENSAKNIAKNIAQFETWSNVEVDILREIWKELKKKGGEEVELKLDELKEKVASHKDNEEWEEFLNTFAKKMLFLTYWKEWDKNYNGISPFYWVNNDLENNRFLVKVVGESFKLPNGIKGTFALDFLNEVMTKL